jgi:hypothetical protein
LVPKAKGSTRRLACIVGAGLTLACATLPWPDEPGVPVAVSQAANVDTGDTFLAILSEKRRAAGRSAPLVTPRYQADIRSFAADLQIGKASAAGVRRAIESWARAAYQRDVEPWVIDCATGAEMQIPAQLVELPSAVISYAAARFRPRSLTRDQCAILVVALTGSETVGSQTPN